LHAPKRGSGRKAANTVAVISVSPDTYRLIDETIPLDKISQYFGYLPPMHVEIHPSVRAVGGGGAPSRKVVYPPSYYFERQLPRAPPSESKKKVPTLQSTTFFPYLALSCLPTVELVHAASVAVTSQRQEFFEDKQNRANFVVWEEDGSYERRICGHLLREREKKSKGGADGSEEPEEELGFDDSADEGSPSSSSASSSKKPSYPLRRIVFEFHFNTLLSVRELKKSVWQGFIDAFTGDFNGFLFLSISQSYVFSFCFSVAS
jgi:hypothetical protein